jgi:formate C-acetyltransferase
MSLMSQPLKANRIASQVAHLLAEKHAMTRLDGWFLTQEIRMRALEAMRAQGRKLSREETQAVLFEAICKELPLSISASAIFAGTQDDAFARTYALINPEFRVETFAGYCDPMAVYGDIEPNDTFTSERIQTVRDFWSKEEYAQALGKVYDETGLETQEVVYFVEQVTGHTIADFGPALEHGVLPLIEKAKQGNSPFYRAVKTSLEAVLILADRYAALARSLATQENDPDRKAELTLIAETCERVPRYGARNLYEAIQSFTLLWTAMTLEQAPNPYAFSVGNLDRILAPYYELEPVDNDVAVGMVRHLLAMFCVGDRNWAISQNIMVGGRDAAENDLTNPMTSVVLEAFRLSNTPQPALSVKLHSKSPDAVYKDMEPFFTTPGSVTPSLFNDDMLFKVLRRKGIADCDVQDYSIAGCQEPLIKGQESGNTTNSWLNLAKVLELTIHGGVSAISGEKIGLSYKELDLDPSNPLGQPVAVRKAFWKHLDYFLKRMEKAANGCTEALSLLPVPYLSTFMGGLETGIDMRDTSAQGTKYNASGCLIHGLSVVSDSFRALDMLKDEAPTELQNLPSVLLRDFAQGQDTRYRLLAAPKYGNDVKAIDEETALIAHEVSKRIGALKNPWGNPFLADWSTPSTHLLYGYWVGATPDGRRSRSPLGYGIDPIPGMANHGLPPRVMSMHSLPYDDFVGGYASHIGLDPNLFQGRRGEGFIEAMREYVINPIFGYGKDIQQIGGYYVYLNVDTAKHLRRILENPKELVPSGIYIMRIHGTFVNFLDLSPAIQEDIINRLDPESTSVTCAG